MSVKIGIIGSGNVGSAISRGLSKAGYESRMSNEENVNEVVSGAEIIVLAVPFGAIDDVVKKMGDKANGKIVIDATNALTSEMKLALGFTTSGAEELQKKLTKAKVVKAFNTVFAQHMDSGKLNGQTLTAFAASDIMKAVLVLLACISVSVAQGKDKKQADFEALQKKVEQNLKNFDDLDFNVFSNQKWDELKRSHTKNVKVHWPDGHVTEGIDKHIEDLKYMFTYAPDTRIKEHPIKIGQGDWTAVYGIMEGTFSKPMKTADGKVIQPTGKSFKIPMATLSHWTKDGNFDEEYLFWDNQTYMNQLGLGK